MGWRGRHALFRVPCQEGQVQHQSHPVSIDKEEEGQESVNGGFGDDVGVETVTEVDGVDVVAGAKLATAQQQGSAVSSVCNAAFPGAAHHSRSLYMMVKKTWRNRLTAFINTANKYSHASPVIVVVVYGVRRR